MRGGQHPNSLAVMGYLSDWMGSEYCGQATRFHVKGFQFSRRFWKAGMVLKIRDDMPVHDVAV